MRVFLSVALASISAAALAVPVVVQHTGRLVNGEDQPVEGQKTLRFRLYDRSGDLAGQPVTPPFWTDQLQVNLLKGVYAVTLGDANQEPLDLTDFDRPEVWLSVELDEKEFSPRLRMASTPYAFAAKLADGAKALTDACDGCVKDAHLGAASVRPAALHAETSALFAAAGHDHDGTYAAAGHDHDDTYAHLSHDHDGTYAAAGHAHDETYSKLDHDHDGLYAALQHQHDAAYAPLTHTHTAAQVTNFAASVPGALAGASITGGVTIDKVGMGVAPGLSRLRSKTQQTATLYPGSMWSHSGLVLGSLNGTNDGSFGGVWHTDTSPVGSYLQLDLGAGNAKEFAQLSIWTTGAVSQGIVAVWDVQFSDDASTWVTAHRKFGPFTAPPAVQPATVFWANRGAHRYWRLLKTNAAGGGGFHAEVQFYERPAHLVTEDPAGSRAVIDQGGILLNDPECPHPGMLKSSDGKFCISSVHAGFNVTWNTMDSNCGQYGSGTKLCTCPQVQQEGYRLLWMPAFDGQIGHYWKGESAGVYTRYQDGCERASSLGATTAHPAVGGFCCKTL